MPKRPPLTLKEICQEGPPVRIRDLLAVSGLCDRTIHREIYAGALSARRRVNKNNSPYFIDRGEAIRWLKQIGVLNGCDK